MDTFTFKDKTHSTFDYTFICDDNDEFIGLKDFDLIKILIELSYLDESDKDKFFLHLIDSKPNLEIIIYIARYSKSPIVIDKLLSQYYGCNEMASVLKHIVVNKSLSNGLYEKIYYCFIKLSSLTDYHIYENDLRYLYSDFLSNEAVPDYLIEKILSSNVTLFTPNEKQQRILLRKNLPQYMLEYILNSFDNKAMKYVYYDIQTRTKILNLKHRLKHSN